MGLLKNVQDVAYGKNKTYANDNLAAGADTLDPYTDMGNRPVAKGFIAVGGNSKTGSVSVVLTFGDGETGDAIVIDEDESFPLDGLNVKSIAISFISAAARYRVVCFPRESWS